MMIFSGTVGGQFLASRNQNFLYTNGFTNHVIDDVLVPAGIGRHVSVKPGMTQLIRYM